MTQDADSKGQEIIRRGVDLAISGLGLAVLAPLMGVVAGAIKVTSSGPVFFRQQRVGRGGRLFWLYKFRTMRPASGGPSITAAGDRRITAIGGWLRRWKLDELPQLLNVLRGEMSLIGPRPEVPGYVRLYDREQRRVLSVLPGITGPSQICFRHEESLLGAQEDAEAYYVTTLLPAKLALDLAYIRNRSLWGDLRLLARTLLVIGRSQVEANKTERAPAGRSGSPKALGSTGGSEYMRP